MGDLYAYAAVAGISVFGMILPVLAVICTRAWYSGALEDRDAQIARMDEALKAADAVVKDAERQGYVQADQTQGRHAR